MAVGIGSSAIEPPALFVPQEPQEAPETNDPFTINADGSIDMDLSGKATIRGERLRVEQRLRVIGNAEIDSDLFVQNVDILQEIQNLNAAIGSIQSQVGSILSSLNS
jgi:hypothetical protein